ncbi:MAG: hypothetical protein ACR2QJ_16570 [Geminicoccaceae bacterium]
MTSSSMNKPGWRSRRRSRLSLVERAVPRLGRPPGNDEAAKPIRNDEARTPVSSKSTPKALARTAHDGEARKSAPLSNGAVEPDLECAAHQRTEHVDDGVKASVNKALEPAEAATDGSDETASSVDPGAQVASSQVEPEGGETEQLAMAQPPEADPEAPPADGGKPSSLIEIDRAEKAARAPATAAGPLLALDWDHLIDNGFTDPRDRGRPLPKTMDGIIRVLIRQALSDQASWRDRVILVTSPIERAGKSSAAINFAFGLTTVGNHHAVLVDVDTLGPGAVARLGGSEFAGINAAIVDESIGIDDLVIKTDLERLTLIASGDAAEDTLDRFASRRMLQILRHLAENPDTLLVIDAPPILVSQEAAVLSVVAGQVVMAVEAGRTTADEIEHALQRIGERHNVSLVLNESSGIIAEDAFAISANGDAMAMRRAPGTNRRLPKAAAAVATAAGVFALGFVLAQSIELSMSDAFAVQHSAMSADAPMALERCSSNGKTTVVSSSHGDW